MKKLFVLFFLIFTYLHISAQNSNSYRAEREKIFDLIHTKLKVDFNFENQTMNGEAWITLKPHFYPQNKLVLDAKAMLIHQVSYKNQNLNFKNDDFYVNIDLPKQFNREEELTLFIKYTAQPEKVKDKLTGELTSTKGLYFINPKGTELNKPTQIWTQGEPEANSCWFPTIDAPNQKSSQEIYITVPNKYLTLSNGKLENQTNNNNGTRTDYWNFTQKHAPYLFFMGIGEFTVVKDAYKDILVDYYVEDKYAPYAKEIFGDTPEMIKFFSEKTGIEYPWNKYSQMVCRDYRFGAMENTTAIIHNEKAHQVSGQLIDKNIQENTIAHEVFHHWFGNLVTTESWSNLTLNESFANYSEYLWREYKYGKKDADAHLYNEVAQYKNGQNVNKHLVRFYYDEEMDMFDAVSYNKGGAILHMLRNYLGDEAFFKGLNVYLTDNKYSSAEVPQLRMAFEEVSGKDLNFFFNQWFYGSGHPNIEVSYDYNKIRKNVTVTLYQTQNEAFQFPIAIDVFESGKKIRKNVFVTDREASFTFDYQEQPELIQVNSDGVLVCDINENKILSDYIFQLQHVDVFEYKREALIEVAKQQTEKKAFDAIENALNDDYYKIRILALEHIDLVNKQTKKRAIQKIINLANNDPKTLVQATAIETLGKLTDPAFESTLVNALNSKSFSVRGKALVALYYINKELAIQKSKEFPKEVKDLIATPLTRIYIEANDDSQLTFMAGNVVSGMYLSPDEKTRDLYKKVYSKIAKSDNSEAIQNLVSDIVVKGKQYTQYQFDKVGVDLMRKMIEKQKDSNHTNKAMNIEIIQKAMARLLGN